MLMVVLLIGLGWHVDFSNNLTIQYGKYSAINSTITFPITYTLISYVYISGYISDCTPVITEQTIEGFKTSACFWQSDGHPFHRMNWLAIGN